MSTIIEKAAMSDSEAILKVLEPYNMHHVPSVEMEELDLSCFFVAKIEGKIVGVSGYKIVSATEGKTTLLGVLPECTSMGLGNDLQHRRMLAMHQQGITKLTTNADRPATIKWYKKYFGYHQIGTLDKLMSFGHPDIDQWTTLETDLDKYFKDLQQ